MEPAPETSVVGSKPACTAVRFARVTALGQPALSGSGRLAFAAKVSQPVKPRKRTGIFVYE